MISIHYYLLAATIIYSHYFPSQPRVQINVQDGEEQDNSDTCSVKSSTSGISEVSGYSTTSDASKVCTHLYLVGGGGGRGVEG